MVLTDLLQEEGFRLQCRVYGRASADATEGFVHPIPKALLRAGTLGFEEIA
jgi:hypothetical protein